MKRNLLALIFLLSVKNIILAQDNTDAYLVKILEKNADKFGEILKNPSKYRVQILYTQINRNAKNIPTFKSYSYRVNPNEYFYPASTVKLPACILALEKLNTLKINNLDKHSLMYTDAAKTISDYPPQYLDEKNVPCSIEHYIKKILLVSDNDAFNRLYEFVGQEPFNENLIEKGMSPRIVHRLSIPMSREQNRTSNAILFYNKQKNDTIYYQKEQIYSKIYAPKAPIKIGEGYMRADTIVREPFDFTYKNYFHIADQQQLLRSILFPETLPSTLQFKLKKDDYRFLWQYMSEYPTESDTPQYDTTFYNSYCKFLMFGDKKEKIPANIRIFNKVGDAYGFLIDNAYIIDFDNKIEFMLTACIYVNSDGIFNDDKYDYDTIGFPFMGNLGRVIYEHELKRKRKHKPNLSQFIFNY